MKKLKTLIHLIVLTGLCGGLAAWNQSEPSVFLIGDSISMQYGPYLEKFLAGSVTFSRKLDDGQAEKNLDVPVGANGGDSRMVLAYLKIKVKEPGFKPDYLVLNCGLHDIKHNVPEGKIQVNETEYRQNLLGIMAVLREKNIGLIWISTTAVVDSIHNKKSNSMKRYAADVETYNKIADELFNDNHVPIVDLFSFTQKLGVEQFIDHVHYNEQTRAMQGAYLAGFIQSHFGLEHKGKGHR